MHRKIQILMLLLLAVCLTVLVGCVADDPAPVPNQIPNSELIPAPAPAPAVQTTPSPVAGAHPSDILPRLEAAYNNRDIYAMARCFEPGVIEAAFGVLDLFGMDGTLVEFLMPFVSTALGVSGVLDEGQWGTVELTEETTQISGNVALLTYNVRITYADGSTFGITETIHTVLVDGEWYIAAIQFPALSAGSRNEINSSDSQAASDENTFGVGDFSIIGAWQQTYGKPGWEVVNTRIVVFNTNHESNIFSPLDTFSISGGGDGSFWLHVTGLLGGDLNYWVVVIDNDNIEVYDGNKTTLAFIFQRME